MPRRRRAGGPTNLGRLAQVIATNTLAHNRRAKSLGGRLARVCPAGCNSFRARTAIGAASKCGPRNHWHLARRRSSFAGNHLRRSLHTLPAVLIVVDSAGLSVFQRTPPSLEKLQPPLNHPPDRGVVTLASTPLKGLSSRTLSRAMAGSVSGGCIFSKFILQGRTD